MSWNIILYESKSRQPIEHFIKSLQPQTIAKLTRQFELLEEFGARLGMPNAKPLGGGLYELRVRGKQEVRLIYIFVKKENIYILHGFLKKTQAIARADLNIAKVRRKEVEEL